MIRRYLKKLLAEILPPAPPPVLFEFTGLQGQLERLNTSIDTLRTIELKREAQRGY
jgi:hypothetical protein